MTSSIKYSKSECVFIICYLFVIFSCSTNNPIRTAKTIPSDKSYHNIGIELKPLYFKSGYIDTANMPGNLEIEKYSPTATYSYRRGMFDLMELEIGLGAGMIFGGVSAWLKCPLTKASNGYGTPYKQQISKYGSSISIGGNFANDFSSVDGWGEFNLIASYLFSYDLSHNIKDKTLLTLYTGVEAFLGGEGIAKYKTNENEYISGSWNKYGIIIPLGVSKMHNKFTGSMGARAFLPIYFNKRIYDGDLRIKNNIDKLNSYFSMYFNASYSFI